MGDRKFQKNSKKLKKLKNTITDSSEAKIGGKLLRTRENKNYHSVSFLPDGEEKIPKKNIKKIQKLKNTITASFQGKIGWKKLRKGENKNYRYVSFLPDGQQKIPKK